MWLVGFSSPSFQQGDNPGAALSNRLSRFATLQHYWALHALLLLWPQWLCFDWALGCVPVLDVDSPDLRLFTPVLLGCVLVLIFTQALEEARNARWVIEATVAELPPKVTLPYIHQFVVQACVDLGSRLSCPALPTLNKPPCHRWFCGG